MHFARLFLISGCILYFIVNTLIQKVNKSPSKFKSDDMDSKYNVKRPFHLICFKFVQFGSVPVFLMSQLCSLYLFQ